MAEHGGKRLIAGSRGRRLAVLLLAVLVMAPAFSGCAYVKNRGNDALDILDIGVNVQKKPTLGLYLGVLAVLPVGYQDFDGHVVGLAGRSFGVVPARQHATGLILWGSEQFAYGDAFDIDDPESPPSWRVGALGLAEGPVPPPRDFISCPKVLQLGWVGVTVTCKPNELLDLVLGLFTVDMMEDDEFPRPAAAIAPTAPPTTPVPPAPPAPPKSI